MRIGIKVYPDGIDNDHRDIFDYLEVYVPPGTDPSLFEGRQIPLAIHAAHVLHGFDIADPALHDWNASIIEAAVAAADAAKAPWIVLHPGRDHGLDSKATMIRFLEEYYDKRFLLENCPVVDPTHNDDRYLCPMPTEMAEVAVELGLGIVLDFAHAICTANILGYDPSSVIREFMLLGPRVFHLSGIDAGATHDMHRHLREAENDYSFLKDLPDNASVTLETGTNHAPERYLDDVAILRRALGR